MQNHQYLTSQHFPQSTQGKDLRNKLRPRPSFGKAPNQQYNKRKQYTKRCKPDDPFAA